jgi:hypothetical protein
MAVKSLGDVLTEWLQVRYGGAWPVADETPPEVEAPAAIVAAQGAAVQRQLPLRWELPRYERGSRRARRAAGARG